MVPVRSALPSSSVVLVRLLKSLLPPASAAAAVGANSDLICRIACFMDTAGGTLCSLCISVGPRVATKIRHKYLGKNEAYVVKCLKRLDAIPDIQNHYPTFVESLPLFDKCRGDIQTWMKVNPDWRSRISQDNIRRFKGDVSAIISKRGRQTRIRLDPNVVFNNPAVAIEIGLKDVVETLVTDHGIDVSARRWASFTSKDLVENEDLIILAMVRGDASIVDTLLSSRKFDMRAVLGRNSLIYITTAYAHLIETECIERLVSHQSFDANFILQDTRGDEMPLLWALFGFLSALRKRSELSFGLKVINTLLANGADPEPDGAFHPLDHVKNWWDFEKDEEIKERLFSC